MVRKTILLLWCASAIWLLPFGFLESPGRGIAADAAPKVPEAEKPQDQAKAAKAKDKAKAAKQKAKPKPVPKRAANRAGAGFGAFLNRTLRAFRGGGRAKVEAPKIDVNDPMIKQFEQQYGRKFRQLYRTELHFIRMVCQPTKQQYQQISANGETVLKSTLRKFAVANQQRRGGWQVAGAQSSQPHNPRKLIADGLFRSVKVTLSAEQATRYQQECDRRSTARKRAAVLNLLAHIDKHLVLMHEQRVKLRELLDENWNESWGEPQRLMNLNHSLPQLPDNKVLPVLNESQKKVWRGIPKHGNGFSGLHMAFVRGIEIEDEVWDEEQAADHQEQADAKAAAPTDQKAEENK
jgi:hypothetical protein